MNETPQYIVSRLLRLGFYQSDIAARCGTTQSTVSRIYTGDQKNIDYRIVDSLRKLYNRGNKQCKKTK